MNSFNTRRLNYPVSTWETLYAPLWGVNGAGRLRVSLTRPRVSPSTMTANGTSPRKGHSLDGEAYEQIARSLVVQRLEKVRFDVHEATVAAAERVEDGDDLAEIVDDIEEELSHARIQVDDLKDGMETEGTDE